MYDVFINKIRQCIGERVTDGDNTYAGHMVKCVRRNIIVITYSPPIMLRVIMWSHASQFGDLS